MKFLLDSLTVNYRQSLQSKAMKKNEYLKTKYHNKLFNGILNVKNTTKCDCILIYFL